MKTSIIAVLACFGLLEASAKSVNNAHAASAINRESKVLPAGKYKFKNVKTGQWLHYTHSNQQIYPSGSASWMSVKGHEKHVIISPAQSNDKCFSAQWDAKTQGGVDWSVALYDCAVTKFKRDNVEERALEERSESSENDLEKRWSSQGAVRGAKQYWYIHGAHKQNAWHIVPSDHILDQTTRAVASCVRIARYNKNSKMTCLNQLNNSDASQMWYIYNSHGKLVTN